MIIIYPPTIDFEWMVQRPQQLMKEFAKLGQTVYYCQQHLVKGKPSQLIAPNLWLVWDKTFLPKNADVLWIGNPAIQHEVSSYQTKVVVYDCCDDFYSCWGKNEDELTKKATIVVTTADRIYNRKITEKGKDKVFLIPNGMDSAHFQYKTYGVPTDLQKYKSMKTLGYVGALADWVDWELVKDTAIKLKEWQIVLVGPEYHRVPDFIKHIGNIKMLGLKDYSTLPAYISNIDVCMIPFKINTITRSTNPIKLYEYLACGKPVVTTDMDEIRKYSDIVKICLPNEDFAQKVREILMGNTPEKEKERISRIQGETWRKRAEHALQILSPYLPQ
jgi:glycosyltransferase involved in cell wall biosynthesis